MMRTLALTLAVVLLASSVRAGSLEMELEAMSAEMLDVLFPHRFPATPLVHGAEADKFRFLHAQVDEEVQLGSSESSTKQFNKARGTISVVATKVVVNGDDDKQNAAGAADSNDDAAIDAAALKKVSRECPRSVCGAKQNGTCPIMGGICCKGSSVCCPKDATCLTTDPPTCVHDTETEVNRCAEEECKDGHHCPHEGVATCCVGGNVCCAKDYKCRATSPPTCEKILSETERAQHAAMEKKLIADKKAEIAAARSKRAAKHAAELAEKASTHGTKANAKAAEHRAKTAATHAAHKKKQAELHHKRTTESGQKAAEHTQKQAAQAQEGAHKDKKQKAAEMAHKTKVAENAKKANERHHKAVERKNKIAAQERKRKHAAEQAKKRSRNMYRICGLARSCPGGWRDHGYVGVILNRHHYNQNPFHGGGYFNGHWRWTHPKLCCSYKSHNNLHGHVYSFGLAGRGGCPSGTRDRGQAGVIMWRHHYYHYQGHWAGRGGNYNGGWLWTHPRLCQSWASEKLASHRSCMLARHCRNGWIDRGYIGIIMRNHDYNRNPFNHGGGYNGGWRWTHPRLCCPR